MKLRKGKCTPSLNVLMRNFLCSNAVCSIDCINTVAMNLYKLFKIMERQAHECLIPAAATEAGNYLSSQPGVSVNHGAGS
jgi:hypothetical protein